MAHLTILFALGCVCLFIHFKSEKIMATQAEHAQALRDLREQNEKAAAEQAAALQRLQDALDNAGGTTPEVDEAMAALRASIQAEDDLNPDEPVPTP